MGPDIIEVNAKILQWIKRPYRTWIPGSLLKSLQTVFLVQSTPDIPTILAFLTHYQHVRNTLSPCYPHVYSLPLSNYWSNPTFSVRLTLTMIFIYPQTPYIALLFLFSIALTLHKIYLFNMFCLLANSASWKEHNEGIICSVLFTGVTQISRVSYK